MFVFRYTNFTINNATGELQTNGVLDRENDGLPEDDTLSFRVFAHDKGTPPRTNTTVVRVHVIDANDNSPRFLQQEVSLTVIELSNNSHIYRAEVRSCTVKFMKIIYLCLIEIACLRLICLSIQ